MECSEGKPPPLSGSHFGHFLSAGGTKRGKQEAHPVSEQAPCLGKYILEM